MTAEMIRERVLSRDAWTVRAIEALHARQTEDEQEGQGTHYRNARGFNRADARYLSSLAEQIGDWRAGRSPWAQPLSRRQLTVARQLLPKYSGQLAAIAAERA